MKLLLFGLPLSTDRRLRDHSGDWHEAVPDPHSFSAIPTSKNEHTPYSAGELRELKASVGAGFTHIVVPASRDWKKVQDQFQFDCRVHVARLWQPLRDVKWEDLKARLREIVSLDEKWLAELCPSDLRHALLLPPTVFRTNKRTDKYWHTCDAYSEKGITRAKALLEAVEREHRKKDRDGQRSWIDADDRRYKVDPSKHARTQDDRAGERSFRFCFEIPPGFHYDVEHEAGRPFSVPIDGHSELVTHCNVSPRGGIRRG